MLILLPPSEGKTAPSRGGPLELATLSFPTMTDTRQAVADSLVRLARGPAAKARQVLGISAKQTEELQRDADLWSIPTAPAAAVYTGVLYDALDFATVSAAQKRRASADIAVASALFGLVRLGDRIPAYRLSADTTLPRVGRLAAAWRDIVQHELTVTARRGVILDLRSSSYVALGPVPTQLADRTAVARVLHEKAGKRSVVSHHNKATKGRLVRSLLAEPRPASIPDLAGALGSAGYRVELAAPTKDGLPWTIDVVVTEI